MTTKQVFNVLSQGILTLSSKLAEKGRQTVTMM
jgi:hypothetical protein